ncbi:FRIGIDA-like protein 3 [Ananas comosus]|uniref:FRIGIDA-like protein n=1 Tax=Ananas comosus TaxID=4615 RepID=A0A6P5GRU9_ANACO|nr:FRIGIDA-like protein 3 [Ananas comosus]
MDATQSVATLIDSTTSKIQQLQYAIAQLESHSAVSLNVKWKQLEEHFHGLEKSLKERFNELEDQEKEYANEVTETEEMLENREAVVVAKELASLDRLQIKRDAALSEIFDKYKSNGVVDASSKENPDANSSKTDLVDGKNTENCNTDISPNSVLMSLCEKMDAEGLHKYISDNRKNLASIREEIPLALKGARDPFALVLNSLKDFYSGEILGLDGKKDGSLLGLRRTCLMLMESLGSLFDTSMAALNIKEQAKAIALEWKPKLDTLDIDASSGNSLEAHAFLQLLATFGLSSEFDEEEIFKLIPCVSRRRQIAELCRSLGISHKMQGVIEVLVNTGRQIDAINLAYAFGLTEQFAPVPLLKSYLKEARKTPHAKAGNMSPGAQNETNERELSALKSVLKSIEDHNLADQYPPEPLQKRVAQLEKAKADKRRAVEAAKPQSKRARASGTVHNPRAPNNFPNNFPDKSFYPTTPERYPYPYNRQYVYPIEPHHPTMMSSAPYALSPSHTTYYGNGYPVQYQPAYLH